MIRVFHVCYTDKHFVNSKLEFENTERKVFEILDHLPFGPQREKTCLRGFANNKGADQPVHPHSLISAFVIRLFESIISRLASSEISLF